MSLFVDCKEGGTVSPTLRDVLRVKEEHTVEHTDAPETWAISLPGGSRKPQPPKCPWQEALTFKECLPYIPLGREVRPREEVT